jgi:hypothetical protein
LCADYLRWRIAVEQVARGHGERRQGAHDALGGGVAEARWLKLERDPAVDPHCANTLGVAGPRSKCQSIQDVADLLIGRLLPCVDPGHRLGLGRDVSRRRWRTRQHGESNEDTSVAKGQH